MGILEAHTELLELEIRLCEPQLLMTGCPMIGTTGTGQPPVQPTSPPCPALAGRAENTGSDQSTPPPLTPVDFLPAALAICTSQPTSASLHAGPRHILSQGHLALWLAGGFHVCQLPQSSQMPMRQGQCDRYPCLAYGATRPRERKWEVLPGDWTHAFFLGLLTALAESLHGARRRSISARGKTG